MRKISFVITPVRHPLRVQEGHPSKREKHRTKRRKEPRIVINAVFLGGTPATPEPIIDLDPAACVGFIGEGDEGNG